MLGSILGDLRLLGRKRLGPGTRELTLVLEIGMANRRLSLQVKLLLSHTHLLCSQNRHCELSFSQCASLGEGVAGPGGRGLVHRAFPGLAVSLVFWAQWLEACRWHRGRGGGDGQVPLASVTIRVREMDRDLFL